MVMTHFIINEVRHNEVRCESISVVGAKAVRRKRGSAPLEVSSRRLEVLGKGATGPVVFSGSLTCSSKILNGFGEASKQKYQSPKKKKHQ